MQSMHRFIIDPYIHTEQARERSAMSGRTNGTSGSNQSGSPEAGAADRPAEAPETIKEAELRHMKAVPDEVVWTVDGVDGHGPVTMTLVVPQVTITDGAGRSIVVTPKQADVISARLTDLSCFVQDLSEPNPCRY